MRLKIHTSVTSFLKLYVPALPKPRMKSKACQRPTLPARSGSSDSLRTRDQSNTPFPKAFYLLENDLLGSVHSLAERLS